MLSKKDAIDKAIAAGATQDEIDASAALYVRQVGRVPFNNMIRALNLHPWHNDRAAWVRLAAALTARTLARKK